MEKWVKGRQLWKNLINAETIGIFQVQGDGAQNADLEQEKEFDSCLGRTFRKDPMLF